MNTFDQLGESGFLCAMRVRCSASAQPIASCAREISTGGLRANADRSAAAAGLDVAGLVQGATTEQRTVDTALDGAYLDGSYYELQRGTERAARLDWGAPAEDVQGALNALTLTDARVDIAPVGANPSFQPPDYIIRSSCWTARARGTARSQPANVSFFNGYTTGVVSYDASAEDVEAQLNALQSISPSKVTVSRSGPLRDGPDLTGGTQVGGYVWSITFSRDVWRDPTVEHPDDGDFDGNWVGSRGLGDTWSTGVSMEWGKNTGDMPSISCVDSGLYLPNGVLPSDGCLVEEFLKGTEPVGGYFAVSLDTTGHSVINRQASSRPVRSATTPSRASRRAAATARPWRRCSRPCPTSATSPWTRSAVNEGGNNGGFTWTVTFLRDAGSNGYGQFGDCEQRAAPSTTCATRPATCPSSLRLRRELAHGRLLQDRRRPRRLEWRVAFLENPGSYDGYTYPPGAGNLDSITYDTSSLQGTTPAVVNEVLRAGSTPFSGIAFSVAFNGAKTEEMERQEATDEVEYRIPGVAATIGRDGSSASLVYDASFGDSYDRETSLMDYLAPGEVFRLGGVDGGIYSSHAGKVDGSEMLGSLLDYSENAPYFTVREPEMAVQTMTVKDVGGSGWSTEASSLASESLEVDVSELVAGARSLGSYGGAEISHYRVELDPTDTFDDPIREDMYCPTANKRTSYTTDPIPYDAVGSAFDETGVYETLVSSGVARTFQLTNDFFSVVVASGSLAGILFDNDLIQVEGSRREGEVYRVSLLDPSGTTFNLTSPAADEARIFLGTSKTTAKVTRGVHGRRGTSATSEVFCEDETGLLLERRPPRLLRLHGVEARGARRAHRRRRASRYGPATRTASPGSFLDDSPASSTNGFALSLSTNSLEDYNGTIGGAGASVTLTQWQAARPTRTARACPVRPSDVSGLQNGLLYCAAISSVGYLLPQATDSAMKPVATPARGVACRFECLAWDAEDYEVEEQIDLFMSEFARRSFSSHSGLTQRATSGQAPRATRAVDASAASIIATIWSFFALSPPPSSSSKRRSLVVVDALVVDDLGGVALDVAVALAVEAEARQQERVGDVDAEPRPVIDAFSAVDRGDFVPHGHRSRAYANAPLRVGNFHLSAPFIYGVALEALALRRGHRFLHVGSGTGYLSTIAGAGVLLGGGGGGNHGVEAREELVAFARGANRTYAAKGAPLPAEFLRGNALRLDAPGAYDRVYVGAGVADDGAKRAPRAHRALPTCAWHEVLSFMRPDWFSRPDAKKRRFRKKKARLLPMSGFCTIC
ncbi:DNA-binding transcription factor [Aureococcus anophagefferens]|uniref:DNA-binding transcription factor n=1 Tax=Aureococcus anophagefferens TaxID=44056 RepID=A0ABR1FXB5_AURAN